MKGNNNLERGITEEVPQEVENISTKQDTAKVDDTESMEPRKTSLSEIELQDLSGEMATTKGTPTDLGDPESGQSSKEYQKKLEKENIAKKKEESEIPKEKSIRLLSLYRFAEPSDIVWIVVGCICSTITGFLLPLFTLIFGQSMEAFSDTDGDDFIETVKTNTLFYCYLAATSLIVGYLQYFSFQYTANRQARAMRRKYMRAILGQELGWFDVQDSGDFNTRMMSDIPSVQSAISDKVGTVIEIFIQAIGGLLVGFSQNWKLTLVMISLSPIFMLFGLFISKVMIKFSQVAMKVYASAGAIARESLTSIRTVVAFGGEKNEVDRYSMRLRDAYKSSVKLSWLRGAVNGVGNITMIASYALAFWYGGILVSKGEMKPGEVFTVFFSSLISVQAFGQISPLLSVFAEARGCARVIFDIIDRKSKIDSFSNEGKKIEHLSEKIELRNIKMIYPSRPDAVIYEDLSLTIPQGKITALVGASGCGKSTIASLIVRFYDPQEGEVLFDGVNIKDINIRSLRGLFGYVSQEPVLFAATIHQNIVYGLNDETLATMSESEIETKVMNACKIANVYGFLNKLPLGLATVVGERGTQLSGGQKQRIAIARALMSNPPLLILDEATSALDSESEKIVQMALDKASEGRTTIIIAHRLSTIINSDNIVVFSKGKIVEEGNHTQLIDGKGEYFNLVTKQMKKNTKMEDDLETDLTSPNPLSTETEKLKNEENIDEPRQRSIKFIDEQETADENKEKRRMSFRSTRKFTVKQRESVRKHREFAFNNDLITEDELCKLKIDDAHAEDKLWPFHKLVQLALAENKPEFPLIILGILFSILAGFLMPAFSFIFSGMSNSIVMQSGEEFRNNINMWSLLFLLLALGGGLATLFSAGVLGSSGAKLTYRLRVKSFKTMMRQDISYFDKPENQTGALTIRLSQDTQQTKALAGENMANIIGMLGTLIAGLAIAFFSSWKVALAITLCVPFLALGGYLETYIMMNTRVLQRKQFEDTGKIASEAVFSIKTLMILNKQLLFVENFRQSLDKPYRIALKSIYLQSIGYSYAQAVQFLMYAFGFWYGSRLVHQGQINFDQMMRAFSSILLSAMTLGNSGSMITQIQKGKIAAKNIFRDFAVAPKIDVASEMGRRIENLEGRIEFRNITFTYPTRPDSIILDKISVCAESGKVLAICGSSGCGKSTLLSLLQRFYRPKSGEILVDGVKIEAINLAWLRRRIGYVGQEPSLFGSTIADNIAFGIDTDATQKEIENASRIAKCHDFIRKLPEGYLTKVGDQGTHLSGGQKQRIAIARAIIRDPQILLLDEATSALDAESEIDVQEALMYAARGRTTIVVAHRLSTIKNADCIIVLDKGQVKERGTHEDLLSINGLYANLVRQQTGTQ